MEQVLKELGLYDLTGHLIPGIIVVWMLIYVANAILHRQKSEPINRSVLEMIVAGYVTGHLLQAIGSFLEQLFRPSLFWRPLDQLYADDPAFRDALNDMIKKIFVNAAQKDPIILCQTYVRVHDLNAYTDTMQARHTFYRGLTLALFISGCALVVEWFWRRRQAHRGRVLVMAGLLLIATGVSFGRMVKIDFYYVDGIYRTFYAGALSNVKTPTAPATP
jgi:hypothetical protein